MKLSEQVFRNVQIYDECIISSLTVLKNMLKISCNPCVYLQRFQKDMRVSDFKKENLRKEETIHMCVKVREFQENIQVTFHPKIKRNLYWWLENGIFISRTFEFFFLLLLF